MKEAIGWSAFYIALPLAFAGYVFLDFGNDRGLEFLTGYLVEKSLSVDNLFVFLLLLGAFAVPKELQQRVLLYGIVGRPGAAQHLHRRRRRGALGLRLDVPGLRPDPGRHRGQDPA